MAAAFLAPLALQALSSKGGGSGTDPGSGIGGAPSAGPISVSTSSSARTGQISVGGLTINQKSKGIDTKTAVIIGSAIVGVGVFAVVLNRKG